MPLVPAVPPRPPRPLRCLIVVPPLAGHVHPAAALAEELLARGHQVAWAGSGPVLRELLGPDAEVHSTGSRLFRPQGGGGAAALRSLWEGFVVPYARFTRKALDGVVQEWRPDLLLVDQHAPAGALVAHRHGLPWVSLAPSALELAGLPREAREAREHADQAELAELAELAVWQCELLRELWRQAGLPSAEYTDPRFSPTLLLAFTGPALTGARPFPAHFALVGPLLGHRPAAPPFPWARLDPGRRNVLVTLGTLAADVAGDFHQRAAEALRPLADRVQAVVAAPAGGLAGLPAHVLGVERVPTLELLARAPVGAVLCHGGMNTVNEALAHGVPLVLAPIRHDQPIVAAQVAAAGAGLVVDFAAATPAELREALCAVLERPAHRAAAARVGRELLAQGGARTAVDRIEEALSMVS
ncbi:glycosyltransferase [Kitasatospora sp. NBC_01287]|uniref:glycosyltransferase n=1 Tax=Kitasatospora sp. NBC_01287 TaxID=2903573 RepID=UPI00225BD5E8|nr:glycosyltransferase [Kitasatospora sp. NBC_01287]MCX4744496.1 glycosyltransferase [Kitasatospora sp. NBC_01287]